MSLFVENNAKETACDVAERARHNAVADFLETKMVFSSSGTIRNEYKNAAAEISKGCTGLRPQDLQEAKDVLLVETSDMLHVPLFTAEALLRAHGEGHRLSPVKDDALKRILCLGMKYGEWSWANVNLKAEGTLR